MQIGWRVQLSATPPYSYPFTMVLALISLTVISGTSVRAAVTNDTSGTVDVGRTSVSDGYRFDSPIPPASSYVPPGTTQTAPPQPAASSHDVSLLWNCYPRGSNLCSFSVQDYAGLQRYSVIVGSPVSNCYNATTTIDSKIQGSITLSDTWSESLSIGIQFGALHLGASSGWSSTETRSFSQGITMHMEPGQQGALIAVVDYNVTSGSMVVGSTDVSPVFSNQPTGYYTYGGKVIGCDETFDANVTAPIPASSALRIPVLSSRLSVSVILVGILLSCVL